MNYEYVGGTPVLGVNAPVVIGHGCSSALAIKNMILTTERCAQTGVTAKLQNAFKTKPLPNEENYSGNYRCRGLPA